MERKKEIEEFYRKFALILLDVEIMSSRPCKWLLYMSDTALYLVYDILISSSQKK